jgi:hypothetical protein
VSFAILQTHPYLHPCPYLYLYPCPVPIPVPIPVSTYTPTQSPPPNLSLPLSLTSLCTPHAAPQEADDENRKGAKEGAFDMGEGGEDDDSDDDESYEGEREAASAAFSPCTPCTPPYHATLLFSLPLSSLLLQLLTPLPRPRGVMCGRL